MGLWRGYLDLLRHAQFSSSEVRLGSERVLLVISVVNHFAIDTMFSPNTDYLHMLPFPHCARPQLGPHAGDSSNSINQPTALGVYGVEALQPASSLVTASPDQMQQPTFRHESTRYGPDDQVQTPVAEYDDFERSQQQVRQAAQEPEVQRQFCSQCGALSNSAAKFCKFCGAPVAVGTPSMPPGSPAPPAIAEEQHVTAESAQTLKNEPISQTTEAKPAAKGKASSGKPKPSSLTAAVSASLGFEHSGDGRTQPPSLAAC